MRPIHLLPLVAALALGACSDDADDALADGALSADDVAGISDSGIMPQPGEYSTSEELLELDAPGMTDASISDMRSEFAAGAAEPHLFCVTEETTREQWLSAMTGANCTISRLAAEGSDVEGAMSCSADEGLNGEVEFAGTSSEDSANLRMTYATPTAAGENATVRFAVRSERTGESCS